MSSLAPSLPHRARPTGRPGVVVPFLPLSGPPDGPRKGPSREFRSEPPAVRVPHVPLGIRFGVRLRKLRHARGMTQLQVAVAFGIDRTFLSDLERGRKSLSLPFLEVFALGFGLSLSELLDEL